MKTLVFFRKPLVPVFCPSMGLVGTLCTVKPCSSSGRAEWRGMTRCRMGVDGRQITAPAAGPTLLAARTAGRCWDHGQVLF